MLKSLRRALDSLSFAVSERQKWLYLPIILLVILVPLIIPLASGGQKSGKRQVLNVPRFSQQPHGHICGATVASMTSAYFLGDGVDRDEEMAKELFKENDFDRPLFIEDIARSVEGFCKRRAKISKKPLSFKAVKYQINAGYPIIVVTCHKGLNFSHAELIVGYDTTDDAIIYNDPWDGKEHSSVYREYLNSDRKYWLYAAYFG